MSVYVASPSGVVQLPLSSCRRYATCYDCIFARDPHCAWNGAQCVDMMTYTDRWVLKDACVCVRLDQVIHVLQVPFGVFDLSNLKYHGALSHCQLPELLCNDRNIGCDNKHRMQLCT